MKKAKAFGAGRKPSERPVKTCATCGLPFAWRKKWERDWENVKYCSDRCRAAKAATSERKDVVERRHPPRTR
ncbi:DUF2256 domain-containing protein [Deinococcus yavapaiensis]|uniref:DUF2256 domain-containing protein n=1 Tax=Deinococcus yavapaiensis KR-236 TaxID=694435 RepID=A0A318S1L1_9DEIO|nr:DUF2256 domain-containing protein [Deinococcus yavapaiensis]PYE51116.1 hypothetical protein DES52_11548 [Deinococcus yavapaiensis KR-236]